MMMRGGGGGMWGLLRLEAVQKELNLTDEQREQLQALGTRSRGPEARGQGRRGSAQGNRGGNRKSARGNQDRSENQPQGGPEKVLQPQQLERLRQIGLQMRLKMQGADVFSERQLAKELDITSEQKKQFRQLRQEMKKKIQAERPQRGAKGLRDLSQEERIAKTTEMREKLDTLRKEALDQALEVLTNEQKEKLHQLQGKEVKLDMREMGPPMQGGPGQGGPRGEGGRRGEGGSRGEGGRRGPRPGQE